MDFDFNQARKTYGDFWDDDELVRMSLMDAAAESERKLNARIKEIETNREKNYGGMTL